MNYFFSDFPFDLGVLFEAIETQIKTTEDYSTFKNNNIIKFAGQWWNLKKIILSWVIQTKKEKI